METINAKGISGNTYTFELFHMTTSFNPVGAVYMFLKGNVVLYIGKAKDLANRMSNHHKENCAKRNGANQIGVLRVNTDADRDRIERDLIASHKPCCNELLV